MPVWYWLCCHVQGYGSYFGWSGWTKDYLHNKKAPGCNPHSLFLWFLQWWHNDIFFAMKSTVSCVIRLNTHPVYSIFNYYVALETWIIFTIFFCSAQQCFSKHLQNTAELVWVSLDRYHVQLFKSWLAQVTHIILHYLSTHLYFLIKCSNVRRPSEGEMLNVQMGHMALKHHYNL